mmetsp:Transcript_44692/g.140979  ORF Transcript_44692/g.140979 Transcript_44692/m.140979 type:complete len:291 (-) Transcript_44692:240-1112(-)
MQVGDVLRGMVDCVAAEDKDQGDLHRQHGDDGFDNFLEQELERLKRASHHHKATDRLYVLRASANSSAMIDGWWAEFGVFEGISINALAAIAKSRRIEKSKAPTHIYGFDSFEGLPAPETDGRTDWLTRRFDRRGELPRVDESVELIAGWFCDTIPCFLSRAEVRGKPASLIHVDSDIYSSAIFVLEELTRAGAIVEGTIVVFDELLHYEGYERHEMRALWEWGGKFGAEWEWICVKHRVMGREESLGSSVRVPHRHLRSQGYDQSAALRVVKLNTAVVGEQSDRRATES